MLTLFRVATFEDWTDVMYAAMEMHYLSWIYFVSFVIVGTFVVINLFIALPAREAGLNEMLERLTPGSEDISMSSNPMIATSCGIRKPRDDNSSIAP